MTHYRAAYVERPALMQIVNTVIGGAARLGAVNADINPAKEVRLCTADLQRVAIPQDVGRTFDRFGLNSDT
jgi:hypothetical protein